MYHVAHPEISCFPCFPQPIDSTRLGVVVAMRAHDRATFNFVGMLMCRMQDALKALTMANEKLLRGRKLVVTYAHQAPLDQGGVGSSFGGGKVRKGVNEAGRPTALSLLKSAGGGSGRSDGYVSYLFIISSG